MPGSVFVVDDLDHQVGREAGLAAHRTSRPPRTAAVCASDIAASWFALILDLLEPSLRDGLVAALVW